VSGTFRLLLVLALLGAGPLRAASKWLKLDSPRFEFYSSAGKKVAQTTLRDLEGFHRVIGGIVGGFEPKMPVRVLLFRSQAEYQPFRWAKSGDKIGYFLAGRKHDYIVLANSRSVHSVGGMTTSGRGGVRRTSTHIILRDRKQTLFHEYVHLVQHQSSIHLPLWLEEGTAELYSTIDIGKGKARIGKGITAHMLALRDSPLLEADVFLPMNVDSEGYETGETARLFYAQSWALAHMLNLSAPYAEGFPGFLDGFGRGLSQQEAFQAAYGKPITSALDGLQGYVRGFGYRSQDLPIDDARTETAGEPDSLSDLETGLLEADLLLELGYAADAEQMLARLQKRFHDSAEVEQRLGELALRLLDHEEARKRFGRAVELGSNGARAHLGYAQALDETRGEREEVWRHLLQALELDTQLVEAQIFAGMLYNRERRYAQAVPHFEAVKDARPRWSAAWRGLALAHYHTGNVEEARRTAELAKRTAETDYQQAEADQVLRLAASARKSEGQ
jgi:tetratricopeptide (TPR) repeat protein